MSELLARQRPDGLWSIYHGGEPDLNATIEAYAALRLAGLSERAPQLAEAQAFCVERGGIGGGTGLHAHLVRRCSGSGRWGEVPQLLPGARAAAALDARLPLHVRLLGASDRDAARRSSCTTGRCGGWRPDAPGASSTSGRVERARRNVWDDVDRLLRLYARSPFKPGRERALALAERWIIDRQELDGSLGRHPASLGVVADRARLSRPRARLAVHPARARRAGTASSSRTATGSGRRHASRRCGTAASPCSGLPSRVSDAHVPSRRRRSALDPRRRR